MVLLQRLLRAGADGLIGSTQFGFRSKRGTEDALHCVRRAVERAWAERNGCLHLLALDWSRAFDSISTEALVNSLRRLGFPPHVICVIRSIYKDRVFIVKDTGLTSDTHRQEAGICQGCPLSPFLFVAVLTMLIEDARDLLGVKATAALSTGALSELLYADDTLLMSAQPALIEEYVAAIAKAGSYYGMELHWGKFQALSVCSQAEILRPDGQPFAKRDSIGYLGGLISSDGRVDSELSRKLGHAAADFRSLSKAWGHTSISLSRKLQFFNAVIMSKLLYGLSSVCLVAAQRRRLDGFHARCLRKLLRVPAAFISRISNDTVFRRARVRPLSAQLLRRQLLLIGKVARCPAGHAMRVDTFLKDTCRPVLGHYIRKRGRPRTEWATQLLKEGARLFGTAHFERMLSDRSDGAEKRYRREVDEAFK